MTYKPHYYADAGGRVRKISELTLSQVSAGIANSYKRLSLIKVQLNYMHDRLWELRKLENPDVKRTNTTMKILSTLGYKKGQVEFKEVAEKNMRLETILNLVKTKIDADEDIEIIKMLLDNVGEQDD